MSNPVRILQMIGSLNIGGSQSMIMNLYQAIDKEKVQFDFVIDRPGELFYGDAVKRMGGRIYTMPTFTGNNILQIRAAWSKFFANHPEYKVLHSHVRSYASVYLPIAHKYGLTTIIHSHSTSNGSGLKSYVKSILQFPLRFQADYFFSCSDKAGKWLFGENITAGDHYYMLQNAIDLDRYTFDPQIRKTYRDQLQVQDKEVFIHIGRFNLAKNHDFLLKLFSGVVQERSNAVLLLVGDGELRPVIEEQINNYGIQDCVYVLGNRDDVPNLLMAADCFLFPSRWEGLPVTVVEAQASGLPCLISDTITKQVVLSDLVTMLPIDCGTEVWREHLKQIEFIRKDVSPEIIQAGFDIKSTAEWLTSFYIGLVREH